MKSRLDGRSVAILGGGFTGLTAAYRLLQLGAQVTIYEAREEPGGLASTANFGDFWWDRFYHCILTSDGPLLKLIGDLGLANDLVWRKTKVGFFIEDKLYPMSSMREFLAFPHLNLWQKFRFAWGILYACTIHDGRKLEKIAAGDWLKRVFGSQIYQMMWEPLLKCKLGDCREEASAAFIWATITRLYSTRERNSSREECLGYVRGGYRTVFSRLCSEIERLGGQFRTGTRVEQVSNTEEGVCIRGGGKTDAYDRVIAAIPSYTLAQIAPELSDDFRQRLLAAKYLGVVCVVLVLKRSLSPYYVTNLADKAVPFTGIIEMSNLISSVETAGHSLVYLPKYTAPDDPLFQASEEEIWSRFRESLMRVMPNFDDSLIVRRFLFRERFVQPVPTLEYSVTLPPMRTDMRGVLLANTTQIINSTLNNNAMVSIAERAVEMVV
jgi:protoporphyrinogen oxidase